MVGRLAGRTALVTGAGSGLGAAIARRFCAEGTRVIVTDRDGRSASEVAGTMAENTLAMELNTLAMELDVTDEQAWRAAIEAVERHIGALDILVNNAGICLTGTIEQLSVSDWDASHRVNLDGVFHGIRACLPLMRRTCETGTHGAILNISSISGIVAGANLAAYNSSKAAVRHLTKSVALQCAREGGKITCNSIHPAFVDTPILDGFAIDGSREMAIAKLARQIPIGRIGRPEDVASAAVYLCSDEASFVTGAELAIDGGLSAA